MRAYRIAYDGRDYYGAQRQPDVPTVEGVVFEACQALDVWDAETERPPGYSLASRTDAGVSARCQTIGIEAPTWLDPPALNSELPEAVRAWAWAPVPDSFHARHDAVERHYRQFVYAPDADVDTAKQVIERVSGTHDFHNLTTEDGDTERSVEGDIHRDGEFLVVDLWSSGFLREQVRRIGGLVRRVGCGPADLGFVDRVLGPDPLSGPEGIQPEPGVGVVLVDVRYPDIGFRVSPGPRDELRDAFRQRAGGAATEARVLESVAADEPRQA